MRHTSSISTYINSMVLFCSISYRFMDSFISISTNWNKNAISCFCSSELIIETLSIRYLDAMTSLYLQFTQI